MQGSQRVALVTGSTSGIGLGIAEHLLAQGTTVAISGLGDAAQVDDVLGRLRRLGDVVFIAADLGASGAAAGLVQAVEARLGRLDILVNNAGVQHTARTEAFPAAQWERIVAINLGAVFHAIAAALPGMQARGHGRIVNIASVHGHVASREKSAYVAAKHGVIGLTKVVALENAEQDITCNAVCPGWVDTPLVARQVEDRAARDGVPVEQARRALLGEKQPSGRFARIEDVAAAVGFLCGAAGGSITGTSLLVDGGWTAQ